LKYQRESDTIALIKMRTAIRRPTQLTLPVPSTWGGRRPGAGRKPGPRPRVPHRARPAHRAAHPVHATLRASREVGSLRAARLFPAIRAALGSASGRTFRVLHFSVQADHVHLLVEAGDREALSRGLRGLAIRLARAVNRARAKRGRVWADRYHARELTTPREVRSALAYVLMNWAKHRPDARGLDPCASGWWFAGWREQHPGPPPGVDRPVVPPRTWLARVGWRRHGLISRADGPAASWRR
jgi:putative transposase